MVCVLLQDNSAPDPAPVLGTPLFVISIDITSVGSVDKFSIAIVTLELESAEVPELGDNVSSFSCEFAETFASSPKMNKHLLYLETIAH